MQLTPDDVDDVMWLKRAIPMTVGSYEASGLFILEHTEGRTLLAGTKFSFVAAGPTPGDIYAYAHLTARETKDVYNVIRDRTFKEDGEVVFEAGETVDIVESDSPYLTSFLDQLLGLWERRSRLPDGREIKIPSPLPRGDGLTYVWAEPPLRPYEVFSKQLLEPFKGKTLWKHAWINAYVLDEGDTDRWGMVAPIDPDRRDKVMAAPDIDTIGREATEAMDDIALEYTGEDEDQ